MRLLSRLFSAQKWTLSLYFSDDVDENNSSVQENVNLNIYNSRASERTESPRRRDTNKKPVGNEQCFNERCPQGRRPCSRSNSPTPAGPWVWSGTFCTLVFCCPASCPSASRRVDLQDGERGERIQHRFTAPPWPSHTEHSLHKPWWIFHNDAAKQPPDTPWMFPSPPPRIKHKHKEEQEGKDFHLSRHRPDRTEKNCNSHNPSSVN